MVGRLPIDAALAWRLTLHEARVQQAPGRELRDLGDVWLLHDPFDAEPFWNRLVAPVWPERPVEFDRRLDQAITHFATLGRMPHIRPLPLGGRPADLGARLAGAGFLTLGTDRRMVLVDPRPCEALVRRGPTAPGAAIVHSPGTATGLDQFAAAVSLVLAESFSVERRRIAALEADAIGCASRPECGMILLEVHGEPAAAARRVTIDGGTYLSSIGTRPGWRGQGHGGLVTATAVSDALAAGSTFVHLAVEVENERATRLYERLGFAVVGQPVPDLLLA
ncbi:MAG: GNAT family N-acetyltransferase [Chloroflexota bacterium]